MEPSVLYYGDNLPILRSRDYFPNKFVDLVYLDPPFNSNQDYNVLFAEQDGSRSAAQIQAFSDTWRWDAVARRSFDETIEGGGNAAGALGALRTLVGESDMLAYLSMMAPRLGELRRILKPSGSIYLHCDPTASHYLKLLMDSIFGPENFRSEIIWKRSSAHSDTKQGRQQHGRIHDSILFYTMSDTWTWNPVYTPYDPAYIEQFYRHVEQGTGRRFRLGDLTGPGGAAKGNPQYEVMGVTRFWRYSRERMAELIQEGRIIQTSPGSVPQYKRYLDEMPGVPLQDVWTDLGAIAAQASERLGYPTQKPEALLERIITTSSNKGDTVLDPFCGCGTTVAAAQRLQRRWIGIDITHLAITLIRSRLNDSYGAQASYVVVGEPADVAGAEALARQDRYQFQWWALGKIRARPVAEERRKGADAGIDGKLFFREKEGAPVKTIVIQVKSGKLKLSEVRDFGRVIEREKAPVGVLITLDEPTRDMLAEAASMRLYKPEYRLSDDDKYDRYQILSVRDLFEGLQPKYPPFRNVTFVPAPAALPQKKSRGRVHRLSAKSETGSVPSATVETFDLDTESGSGSDNEM